MLYKATGSSQGLIFQEALPEIKRLSHGLTYEGLNRMLETVELTRTRLAGNVNAELTLEWLLITARDIGGR